MKPARRLLLLRIFATVALAATGMLIADALRPERGWCPLQAACSKARSSALGTLFGLPTSSFGAMAFGGFLLMTFLSPPWTQRLLRPAGIAAATFGLFFVAYQFVVLRTVCPYCLVADTMGLACGAVVIGWKP